MLSDPSRYREDTRTSAWGSVSRFGCKSVQPLLLSRCSASSFRLPILFSSLLFLLFTHRRKLLPSFARDLKSTRCSYRSITLSVQLLSGWFLAFANFLSNTPSKAYRAVGPFLARVSKELGEILWYCRRTREGSIQH